MAKKSTHLEALHSTFEENGISPDSIELNDSLLQNIKKYVDAMNCQKDTVSAIVSGKGDYVLALKGNQGLFYEEVRDYFEESVQELKGKERCYKKTVEPEHGGSAVREYYITEDTGWYSERGKW